MSFEYTSGCIFVVKYVWVIGESMGMGMGEKYLFDLQVKKKRYTPDRSFKNGDPKHRDFNRAKILQICNYRIV